MPKSSKNKRTNAPKAHILEPKAFELYKAGVSQREIAEIVGVSEQTISGKNGWKKRFEWDKKLKAYESSSRSSKEILERIISEKIQKVESTEVDQLPKGFEDGLLKLTMVLEKMDKHFDRLAFTIEIMEDFNDYLNAHHPNQVSKFHDLLPEFLNYIGNKYGN